MTNVYAGVGSRKAGGKTLMAIQELAKGMAFNGWFLRSGGAKGCDQAFAHGHFTVSPASGTVYHANDATVDALELASKFHPNWDNLPTYVRKLMGRNAMILLGDYLDTPADLVLCWTQYGIETGGTGHTLRMARYYHIPIVNYGHILNDD